MELGTKSKMFCGCPADHFGKEPNTQTCPVCLALPGALPVPNKKAIEWTILLGLALGSKINLVSHFDRKNYFYPDLPKGYQITQYDQPFCYDGTLNGIRIRRVHLEEDTGKLQHDGGETTIDFNRSGVPLVEIVTEPDFRSIEEVDIYLKKLQKIIRYLGISSADMEKGSMRLEPSISLAPVIPAESGISKNEKDSGRAPLARMTTLDGLELPNYRVELKNINSFRFVRKALEYEIERQQREEHKQETRGWSETKNATFLQREKEEAHDYRYFPEPDIPPIRIFNYQLPIFKKQIPELPDAKSERFQKEYGLSFYQSEILCEDRHVADGFEESVKSNKDFAALEIANSIINKRPLVLKSKIMVDAKIIKQVLAQNFQAVADYKSGKLQILGFLIGQCAKLMPDVDKSMIKNKLEEVLKNERN